MIFKPRDYKHSGRRERRGAGRLTAILDSDEAKIEEAAKALLAAEPVLDDSGITVCVVDGTIILDGEVLSLDHHRRAVICALEAAEGKQVDTRLTVRTNRKHEQGAGCRC